MKTKNNTKTLIKMFADLYLLEKEARDLYNDFLRDLEDREAIKMVEHIRNEEENHMRIAIQLREIVESAA